MLSKRITMPGVKTSSWGGEVMGYSDGYMRAYINKKKKFDKLITDLETLKHQLCPDCKPKLELILNAVEK